ncbi:MAG: S-adenosyl-l-methionine hydroxide adenosyltransferase family protein [Thalassospira sp.]|uniref:SAM hydrolase/SAM-dependent halogenase family protein n=1 Tax=Thalassospira sp. TaxID=1912094 RepID=UPI003A89A0AA
MIFIFSDFGVNGPYSGTMRSVVMRNAPDVAVCELMLDAPDRNPKASSYLLAALTREFTKGDVVLAVVDPGVGSVRKGLVVRADGVTYVGPDNGLFEIIIRRSSDISIQEIVWSPNETSASFHGRDIFAPVAAMLATKRTFAAKDLAITDRCAEPQSWPDQLSEVIYIDTYGNLMTGMMAREGEEKLMIGDHLISKARTFSDVRPGEGFHYCNSIGLCEVAVNCGRADQVFGARIGTPVNAR